MRVLLFSNDLMPFGQLPTSGGGLRCWQLMKGLEAHGIEVLSSMPGFTYLAEKHREQIPEQQRELLWQWGTQDEILRRTKPDAVLFASNWDHFNLTKPLDVPLIIDLHGSRLIETTMWGEPVSTDRKATIFGKADCLLCAGVRQRTYFYGWLLQAGRVPGDEHFIRYIPVSLSPEHFEHHYPEADSTDAPHFVSGGGWFPWQNQSQAIFAICRAVAERRRGSIDIFGTPHETSNMTAEELRIREIYGRVKALSEECPQIRVNGYIGREDLLEIYRRASVAVETMEYNLERELAFTTRTIEYLWCGLPVLYNNFGEISGHIRDYDAGWTVDPANEMEICEAVEEIFTKPELVAQKGRNAQRLVADRFTWDKTIEPLLDFLNNPVKAAAVEPVLGPVTSQASFLSPSGTAVDIPVGTNSGTLRQEFILPAEDIKTVEIPLALVSKESIEKVDRIELRLRARSGSVAARKSYRAAELPSNGKVSIDFPLLRRPVGGTEFALEIEFFASPRCSTSDCPLLVRGLLESSYPFISQGGSRFIGKTLLGQQIRVSSLALSFVPAGDRIYHLKAMVARGLSMLRRGQWRRLLRAGIRRMPGVVCRLKHAAFG